MNEHIRVEHSVLFLLLDFFVSFLAGKKVRATGKKENENRSACKSAIVDLRGGSN